MYQFDSIADWSLTWIALLVLGAVVSVYLAARKTVRGK